MTIIFGLTGGVACGKSSVSKLFQGEHVGVIDADIIGRQVVAIGTEGLDLIKKEFGSEFIIPGIGLDRPRLRKLVFSDKSMLDKLNRLMFPLIERRVGQEIERLARSHQLVCLDAALIIEWGLREQFRPIVVVACSPEKQVARLMARNGLSREEAQAMVNSQVPMTEKIRLADYVIWNEGTRDQLHAASLQVLASVRRHSV